MDAKDSIEVHKKKDVITITKGLEDAEVVEGGEISQTVEAEIDPASELTYLFKVNESETLPDGFSHVDGTLTATTVTPEGRYAVSCEVSGGDADPKTTTASWNVKAAKM